jgi:hypothetical protein
MLDVETLSTGDNAAIIQVGAVRFDWVPCDEAPNGWTSSPYGEFRQNVLWNSEGFGQIDVDTLLWWLKQDGTTRRGVFDQECALHLKTVLCAFFAWVRSGGDAWTVWANSPQDDLRWLRQACERAGVEYEFTYRQPRDMRTLVKVFGVEDDRPLRVGKKHDALDDAHHQALHVVNIMQRVNAANDS